MARRRTRFKVPFLKLNVNRKTVFNIIGFFLIAAAGLFLVAFFSGRDASDGRMLSSLNVELRAGFGIMAYLVPPILLLISSHFFNTKKLKFVKPNITIGSILIFFALLGIFRTGLWGKFVYTNLALDFTVVGSLVILTIAFLVGLILFLDTSVDAFVLFLIDFAKSIYFFFKNYVFRQMLSGEKVVGDKKDPKFIENKPLLINQNRPEQVTPGALKPTGGIAMKPVTTKSTNWIYPPLSLLHDVKQTDADRGDVKANAAIIEGTLDSFGLRARVAEVNYGPTVTQYALTITQGTKLSKITGLSNDLALALAASTGQVRIEAPIPGRALVGVETPNKRPEIVTLKRILATDVFLNNSDPLLVPLGLDVSGKPQAATIDNMPHVLIAGTTGSGKSVMLNAWIASFLFRTKPDDLKLIMVDPKRVELTLYNGIPHLLTEVIVEPDKIINALRWTVAEMEGRYKEFAKVGVRNLEGYNNLGGIDKKPYIIFIIDELADLMIFAANEAEELITRIAQMARATGIHLVLATQRPSVDVITGLMKANIPTRLAFNVSTLVDSRVIIDTPGAEKLLGRGDMLYLPPDQAKPRRIQGPFVTEAEIHALVKFLKENNPEVHYTEEITDREANINAPLRSSGFGGGSGGSDHDPLFNQSIELIAQHDKASASLLQRRLSIGYARAARILDQLEAAGYVGQAEGSKPREVLRRGVQDIEGEVGGQ